MLNITQKNFKRKNKRKRKINWRLYLLISRGHLCCFFFAVTSTTGIAEVVTFYCIAVQTRRDDMLCSLSFKIQTQESFTSPWFHKMNKRTDQNKKTYIWFELDMSRQARAWSHTFCSRNISSRDSCKFEISLNLSTLKVNLKAFTYNLMGFLLVSFLTVCIFSRLSSSLFISTRLT